MSFKPTLMQCSQPEFESIREANNKANEELFLEEEDYLRFLTQPQWKKRVDLDSLKEPGLGKSDQLPPEEQANMFDPFSADMPPMDKREKVPFICSEEYQSYLDSILGKMNECYMIAREARAKGLDPALEPEIIPAHDLAARVEAQVGPPGISDRVRELSKVKNNRELVALLIAQEIVVREEFETPAEALDQAIRTGLSIITEGVLVAPLSGISEVTVEHDGDNTYLRLCFAGPIRSAGGTGQALCVLLADVARRKLDIGDFHPTRQEVERYKEEFAIRKSSQYKPKDDDVEIVANNCPICVDGDGTDKEEVSGNRDLPRVGTNKVRGGMCLVMAEGLMQKASKLKKHVDKLNITGWEFLDNLISHGKGPETGQDKNEMKKKRIEPELKYIQDVVGGRPVIAFPTTKGGLPVRYGRGRTTGLAGIAIHPVTMFAMKEFLAIGTQVKVERPGKAGGLTPCDTIEPSVLKLKDGSVVKPRSIKDFKVISDDIIEILDPGEVLIPYGEFLENNKDLVPGAYAPEWWELEVRAALEKRGWNKIEAHIKSRELHGILAPQAFQISRELDVPLHPSYLVFWEDISSQWALELAQFILVHGKFANEALWKSYRAISIGGGETEVTLPDPCGTEENERFPVLELPLDAKGGGRAKKILEELCLLHRIKENTIQIDQYSWSLVYSLGLTVELLSNDQLAFSPNDTLKMKLEEENIQFSNEPMEHRGAEIEQGDTDDDDYLMQCTMEPDYNTIELLTQISGIKIMPRAPTRIGIRMGRPEKSKERMMKPAVHSLFPVGLEGGPQRLVSKAAEKGKIKVDLGHRKCKSHGNTFQFRCPECGEYTEPMDDPEIAKEDLNVYQLFGAARRNAKEQICNNLKGVQGLISKSKIPEPLEKGILRVKNQVFVFKDGTLRYDMIDIPVTHFRPREIHTTVEKLIEMGYTRDIYRKPLTRDDQVLELRVQDFIPAKGCMVYFIKVCKFIDMLLKRFYGMEPYYNVKTIEDLYGHLALGLAPHTSGGVLTRMIGYSNARVGYAHPYFHASKRRNCDGDEDCLLMLLDGLLNFSRTYLPGGSGGEMDAPLVLSLKVDPNEIDKETHNIDCLSQYPLEFYQAAIEMKHPRDVEHLMSTVGSRLFTPYQYQKIGYTHDTSDINKGVTTTMYKRLEKMWEKVEIQLILAEMLRGANPSYIASRLINTHLIPDMKGNLASFSRQGMKCPSCKTKFRRPPISGRCPHCGSRRFNLNVKMRSVSKYVALANHLVNKYKLPTYTAQRIKILHEAMESLFEDDKIIKTSLQDFMGGGSPFA